MKIFKFRPILAALIFLLSLAGCGTVDSGRYTGFDISKLEKAVTVQDTIYTDSAGFVKYISARSLSESDFYLFQTKGKDSKNRYSYHIAYKQDTVYTVIKQDGDYIIYKKWFER